MLEEIRYAEDVCDDENESDVGKRQATRGLLRRVRGLGGGIKNSLTDIDL